MSSAVKVKVPLKNGMDGTVIKVGVLLKKAVVKKRTFHSENYKTRLFELTEQLLTYYEGDLQNRGKGKRKGSIPVVSMRVVMEVSNDMLDDKTNVFQIVFQDNTDFSTLYVVANSNAERQAWLEAIRSCALLNGAKFFDKYHPGVWTKKKPSYNCCHQPDRNAVGCVCDSFVQRAAAPPLPPPLPPPRPDRAPQKEYVAMYDYECTVDVGLELIAGEKYIIIDDSDENWWKAENSNGEQGYIPSSFIKPTQGLEAYEWYYKGCTIEKVTAILMNSSKEGCFLVRDSISKPGEYTLSIFTSEQGGNVRHYQIKRTETGMYFISHQYPQKSIPDLIFYHKHNSGGILTRLREPPPRGIKPSTAGFGFSQFMLDPKKLTHIRKIGSGCFGVVYEGRYQQKSIEMTVAIKELTVQPFSDAVDQEFQVMTQLSHENLVQLYGVILNQQPQMIITEFLLHGSLKEYLENHRMELMSSKPKYLERKLLDFSVQVCCGMEYLDKKGIIHRDLAARNCLVGADLIVKVGDFGLARQVLEDDAYEMSEGTKFPINWSPPEVLESRLYSSKSDIWAYGILLWEIFSFGAMPYEGMRKDQVMKYVIEGKRLKRPRCAKPSVFNVMLNCWAKTPKDRPTFTEIRIELEGLYPEGQYIPTSPHNFASPLPLELR